MLTTVALASQILGLVATGVALAPTVLQAAGSVKNLLTEGRDPTTEEEAAIRSALDASEADFQAAQPGT